MKDDSETKEAKSLSEFPLLLKSRLERYILIPKEGKKSEDLSLIKDIKIVKKYTKPFIIYVVDANEDTINGLQNYNIEQDKKLVYTSYKKVVKILNMDKVNQLTILSNKKVIIEDSNKASDQSSSTQNKENTDRKEQLNLYFDMFLEYMREKEQNEKNYVNPIVTEVLRSLDNSEGSNDVINLKKKMLLLGYLEERFRLNESFKEQFLDSLIKKGFFEKQISDADSRTTEPSNPVNTQSFDNEEDSLKNKSDVGKTEERNITRVNEGDSFNDKSRNTKELDTTHKNRKRKARKIKEHTSKTIIPREEDASSFSTSSNNDKEKTDPKKSPDDSISQINLYDSDQDSISNSFIGQVLSEVNNHNNIEVVSSNDNKETPTNDLHENSQETIEKTNSDVLTKTYNEEPATKTYNEEESTTIYNEEPVTKTYNEVPVTTTYNEVPVTTIYNEEPENYTLENKEVITRIYSDEPLTTETYNEVPSIATYNEVPSIATYNEVPSIATYNEVPSIATYNEVPSIATYNEVPSIATYNEEQTTTTNNKHYENERGTSNPSFLTSNTRKHTYSTHTNRVHYLDSLKRKALRRRNFKHRMRSALNKHRNENNSKIQVIDIEDMRVKKETKNGIITYFPTDDSLQSERKEDSDPEQKNKSREPEEYSKKEEESQRNAKIVHYKNNADADESENFRKIISVSSDEAMSSDKTHATPISVSDPEKSTSDASNVVLYNKNEAKTNESNSNNTDSYKNKDNVIENSETQYTSGIQEKKPYSQERNAYEENRNRTNVPVSSSDYSHDGNKNNKLKEIADSVQDMTGMHSGGTRNALGNASSASSESGNGSASGKSGNGSASSESGNGSASSESGNGSDKKLTGTQAKEEQNTLKDSKNNANKMNTDPYLDKNDDCLKNDLKETPFVGINTGTILEKTNTNDSNAQKESNIYKIKQNSKILIIGSSSTDHNKQLIDFMEKSVTEEFAETTSDAIEILSNRNDKEEIKLITFKIESVALKELIQSSKPLFIISAGNDGQDACEHYPVGSNVLIVSEAQNTKRKFYANYGKCVDLYVEVPCCSDPTKEPLQGTSFAAARVAAYASLLNSDFPYLKEKLLSKETINHMNSTGNDILQRNMRISDNTFSFVGLFVITAICFLLVFIATIVSSFKQGNKKKKKKNKDKGTLIMKIKGNTENKKL